MKFIRSNILSKVFTVFTAATFLNMGFFVSEVKIFELDLDREMAQHIAELILNVGMEEERDLGDDHREEGKTPLDEVFISPVHATDSMLYVLSHLRKWNHGIPPHSPHVADKVTPPPEACPVLG